jgi:pimeloyl-ACP methyl ester carboxylesterase
MTDIGRSAYGEGKCEEAIIRGVRHNLRRWGRPDGKPLLLLHGTQDSSVTFQFFVDRLSNGWSILAPDFRGHGHSEWTGQGYWFHDFVADLDAIVDTCYPDRRVPIVAHSLGGNIASVFAGLRPDRLSHLLSLDGFGPLTNLIPVDVKQILSHMLSLRVDRRSHSGYPGVSEMAARLRKGNPRLSEEQAQFLAFHNSGKDADGSRRWLFDPVHQRALPSIPVMADWGRIWADIQVPVLWISSSDARPHAAVNIPGEMERRAALMPNLRWVSLPDTGHNIHHDEPALVARLIETFIANPDDDFFTSRKNGDSAY